MTEFEQKQIEQLQQITDALCGINSTMTEIAADIRTLAGCVDINPARFGGLEYTFFNIGGRVGTGI